MDAETTLLFAQLDQILQNQIDYGMTNDEAAATTLAISNMKEQYLAAQEIEKDASATKEQKEYAKNLCAAIAKGVPDMTKAAISAAKAFQKGDPITGSAAVMDLCAAVAPILGSILSAGSLLGAAGGPIGMLAGALFSVIGQILMMFGPKTESMYDQIETLLNKLEEEKELQNIKSAHDDVLNYARALRTGAAKVIPLPLNQPLKVQHDADVLQEALNTFKTLVHDFKPINSVTMDHFWNVMEWLKRSDRQDLDKWPEVLGVWCKSYNDLVTSTMTVALIGHSDQLQLRLQEVESPDLKIPSDIKGSVRNTILAVKGYANARQIEYAACNATALSFLREIAPTARNRGVFFILNGGEVNAGSGESVIKRDEWHNVYGYTRRMAVTLAKQDVTAGSLNPQYHFWNLGAQHYRPVPAGTYDDASHARLTFNKLTTGGASSDSTALRDKASELSDVWSIPDPTSKNGAYIYYSDGPGMPNGVQLYKLDDDKKFDRVNWWPNTTSPLARVRVITPAPVRLVDDPDKDAMAAAIWKGVDFSQSIVYGAMSGSSEIYVDRLNERCYVPAPWKTYSGIAVDPNFVWVFSSTAFTCATHSSVLKSIDSKGAIAPRWLQTPSLDSLLYDGDQYPGNIDEREGRIPPHPGLIDLAPCEDGSLFMCLTTRKIDKTIVPYDRNYFDATDRNALYTTAYSIDLKAQKVTVERWTKFAGGAGASQVQKLPIPCWKVFDSLNADLSARAKTATA
jgi:hypothetical protein